MVTAPAVRSLSFSRAQYPHLHQHCRPVGLVHVGHRVGCGGRVAAGADAGRRSDAGADSWCDRLILSRDHGDPLLFLEIPPTSIAGNGGKVHFKSVVFV